MLEWRTSTSPMRVRVPLLFFPFLFLLSCQGEVPRASLVLNIALLPQAYEGGGFSLPVTQAERTVPCAKAGVSRLQMIVERGSGREPLLYDLTSFLNSDCQGSLIVPEEENLYFRIEGYDGNNELVREGFAEFSVTSETNELLFLLWKARRTPASNLFPSDLVAVDTVKTAATDVRLVLHFAHPATPPSRDRQDSSSLSSWLLLFREGTNPCCTLALADPHPDGFPLQSFSPIPVQRVPFRFLGSSLHILLSPSLFPGNTLPKEVRFMKAGEDPQAVLNVSQGWISLTLE